jgi:CheY-like chemotaxis protein
LAAEDVMNDVRVLIVDDESSIRSMVRTCLESGHYRIEEAAEGLDAFDRIEASPPDVMLLDLAMPRMDGMSLLAELRLLHPRPLTRAIVMTAFSSVRRAMDAMRLGACDFLEKPFLPADVRLSVACAMSEPLPLTPVERAGYAEVLGLIRHCLRAGDLAAAESLLTTAGLLGDDDAQFLNLAGVFVEANGRAATARHYYDRAVRLDSGCEAATSNLKRLDEIERHGRSDRELMLGDERRGRAGERDDWHRGDVAERLRRLMTN